MTGMEQQTWTAVDEYLNEMLIGSDPILQDALAANAQAKLPAFDVAPNQGKLLQLLVRMCRATRVLEIGTLGGYSTIWLARALPPDGVVVTLESEAGHADVAARNIRNANLEHLVQIRVGLALDTLQQLAQEATELFDFIFIDADKPNNPAYLQWALRLSRPGTVIFADSVIRDGAIVDPKNSDPRVQGVQQFFRDLAETRCLTATAVQTVGSKGYDGFALLFVDET